MSFLVDGYNLMYAAGAAPPPGGPRAAFDAARERFLLWLNGTPAVRGTSETVRLVFDAQNSTRDLGSTTRGRLLVTFSFGQTADDLIEALLAVERHPQTVGVVSNDGRVQASARRRGCPVLTCEAFLDWLREPPATDGRVAAADEKAVAMTPDELAALMRVFGG